MIGILAIVVFAVQATVVLTRGGARYPSGVDPALCPNYPHCDNVLLAAYATGDYQRHYDGGDRYRDGGDRYRDGGDRYRDGGDHYYDGGHYGSGYLHRPSAAAIPSPYTEPGYPAGLTSSNCPNYPYCSHQVPAEAFRYAHKRHPSGVSPQNCPDYPYCH